MITQLKSNWKTYLKLGIYGLGIFLLGATIGTTLQGFDIFRQIFINTMSGILQNLAWFILIIWGIKTISQEMPSWIDKVQENKRRKDLIKWAQDKK